MSYDIIFKRVYESCEKHDGARVLVDRLWPRGKRREDLGLTEWYQEAAPSPALRRRWHRGEIDDAQFATAYRTELEEKTDTLLPLMRHSRLGRLTLLTASRNPNRSHLPVLREALRSALTRDDDMADGREPSSPTCYGR